MHQLQFACHDLFRFVMSQHCFRSVQSAAGIPWRVSLSTNHSTRPAASDLCRSQIWQSQRQKVGHDEFIRVYWRCYNKAVLGREVCTFGNSFVIQRRKRPSHGERGTEGYNSIEFVILKVFLLSSQHSLGPTVNFTKIKFLFSTGLFYFLYYIYLYLFQKRQLKSNVCCSEIVYRNLCVIADEIVESITKTSNLGPIIENSTINHSVLNWYFTHSPVLN